ncbi:MAG: helix-turn-helix transcriptional regulator [Chloroflexota bacterium]
MADHAGDRFQVGAAVRSIRTAIRWSQQTLAERAGVSQSMVSLVERGRVDDLTLGTASALLEAMGARLIVGVDSPFLGERTRQRDPAHALMAAHVVRRLRASGWVVVTEVEVGGDRSRGWIDVLAFHPTTAVLLVIEVKTEIHDLGQIERTLGWYEREAWSASRRIGRRPMRAAGSLLLLASRDNDDRVAENAGSIRAGFAIKSRQLGEIVDAGSVPAPRTRAIAMIDPESRRRAWCRPLWIDGRRTPAPYTDYADFLRSSGASRRRPR